MGGLGLVGLGFRHCEDHQEDMMGGEKLDRKKLGDVACHHARKTLLCLQKVAKWEKKTNVSVFLIWFIYGLV